ncbi:hypothetical protein, partial [Salmonella enterica]|uniref:hypothetical protein n=1 Tax=Salmonella enterica TaxID=28901 RepID=UPI0039E871D9
KKDDSPEVGVFKVDMLTYKTRKGRVDKPDFIEVTYQCGFRRFKQPLCLEHTNFALKKARDWWRKATNNNEGSDIPTTLDEAIQRWG